MKKTVEYVIICEDGEEFIFNNYREALNLFLELMENQMSNVDQFYSKEWIGDDLNEGDVELFYDKSENFNHDAPMLLVFDEDMYIFLKNYPNFHISGSIEGMRDLFYGNEAYLVVCGDYIYKIPKEIYDGFIYGFHGSWINTDSNQIMKRISKDVFLAINVAEIQGEIAFDYNEIDFKELNNEDIESYINGYYESLDEIHEIYGNTDEDSWKLIVAEIISEVEFSSKGKEDFTNIFKDEDELNQYLENLNIKHHIEL